MKKNFVIGQANELIKEGRIYDLHNSYDFEDMLTGNDDEMVIVFSPNPIYGNQFPKISLHIQQLDRIITSPGFDIKNVGDIDEIGYKDRRDYDINWLLDEKQISGMEDLFFRFTSGHYIRLHGKRIELKEITMDDNS